MNEETFAIISILIVGVIFRQVIRFEDWIRKRRKPK